MQKDYTNKFKGLEQNGYKMLPVKELISKVMEVEDVKYYEISDSYAVRFFNKNNKMIASVSFKTIGKMNTNTIAFESLGYLSKIYLAETIANYSISAFNK